MLYLQLLYTYRITISIFLATLFKYCVTRSTIALFKHDPECSAVCCDGVVNSLGQNFDIRFFGITDDIKQVLTDATVVSFPGGIGDADKFYELFRRRYSNAIADFVDQGGYYLGICMGAYWAGSNYFDLLNDVDAVQYIKRPNTDIRRSYGTVAPVVWQGQAQKMFFYDGCALVGDESKFTTVARYANNDPMAIIQGRIGLIGCHPESQNDWYQETFPYIKQYWHYGIHHILLSNFVKQLTQSGV